MANIFEKVLNKEIILEPFPHIVVEGLIEESTYADIDSEFPSGLSITRQNAMRRYLLQRMSTGCAIEDVMEEIQHISGVFQGLVSYESLKVYENAIKDGISFNPELIQNTSVTLQFDNLKYVQGLNPFKKLKEDWKDAKIDFLRKFREWMPREFREDDSLFKSLERSTYSRGDIRINTKVTTEGTSVIGPHIDSPQEVIAGLIYCRSDKDVGHGGDLALFKLKKDANQRFMSINKRKIPYKYLVLAKKIFYQKNTALFFPNSLRAIHAVTPRDLNTSERRIINVSIEIPGKKTLWDKNLGVDPAL